MKRVYVLLEIILKIKSAFKASAIFIHLPNIQSEKTAYLDTWVSLSIINAFLHKIKIRFKAEIITQFDICQKIANDRATIVIVKSKFKPGAREAPMFSTWNYDNLFLYNIMSFLEWLFSSFALFKFPFSFGQCTLSLQKPLLVRIPRD